MKSTVEYLQELIDAREQMKTSINNKGVQVSGGLNSYDDAIKKFSGSDVKISGLRFAYSTFERLPHGYDVTGMRNCSWMFYKCKNLVEQPPMNPHPINLVHTFSQCRSITEIELDITDVTSMEGTFDNCISLVKLTLKGQPQSDVYVSPYTFDNITTNGTLYYDSRYDYSRIISYIPSTWTAVPINIEE